MTITNLSTGAAASPAGHIAGGVSRARLDADALIVVIRTPKSASSSLAAIAAQAFSDGRAFMLPNTLDIEGSISALQHLRHIRHAARVNYRWHRLLRLEQVFERINLEAKPGDFLTGGHIDFDTCHNALTRPFKFITLVRNPIDRASSEYAYARAGFSRKNRLAKFDASLIAKVAGRHSFEGYLDFLTDHRAAFGDIACRYVGVKPGDDIAAHFAAHAYHFGTVDNLPAFARGLAARTGHIVEERHLNATTAARIKLTSSERRKIEKLYPGDFALYEWCRAQETHAAAPRPQRLALSLVGATA
jgi:hypothetical protein